MSDEDIDKAVKEAQEYEAQDKKRKEGIDARNDADSFVFQTEKALQDVGDKIDPSQKQVVEDDIKALKDTLEQTKDRELTDSEIDTIKSQKEKLMTDAQALFAKVYESAQGAAGAQGAGPDMSGMGGASASDAGAADDVVDGDYREV
jgi:molecular chaperone DnaK